MSTRKVRAWMWPLLAALACACEPATPSERTREHRTGKRDEQPPATEVIDEAAEAEPEPTSDEPPEPSEAPAAKPPTAPADLPSPPAPSSDPPATVEPPQQPSESPDPSTPPSKPGLRLRGELRIALTLPLGIALRVRLSTVLESGVLHELANGELDASGAFDLLLGAELEPGLVVAELLDARGQRLGAVWSALASKPGDSLQLPVLDL
ncbi:MAG TPA: hypothetical protein VFZ61_24585, partial [Polyangiales bacterium]